jgi:hypothetical protein
LPKRDQLSPNDPKHKCLLGVLMSRQALEDLDTYSRKARFKPLTP